ncbi:hypothetical protein EVAR_20566_1 [Eumeta japonica]|uniref:Uncharacterized protein n=1 Tax=Eumeta variegata TaxID=151549 RepID=A0A4C1UTQ5_EUMVA|nr:hypothetical protein EVAR_20566_1 [Eumeta japonica]
MASSGGPSGPGGGSGAVEWAEGAPVWFQPAGAAAPLPGELVEVHRAARVLLVSAIVNGKQLLSLWRNFDVMTMSTDWFKFAELVYWTSASRELLTAVTGRCDVREQ